MPGSSNERLSLLCLANDLPPSGVHISCCEILLLCCSFVSYYIVPLGFGMGPVVAWGSCLDEGCL